MYGVWPKGRNTPIVLRAEDRAEAVRKARKKPAAGAKNPIVSARPLNERDAKAARKGQWIRTRADGSRTTSKGSYTYRPQLKKKAKGRAF